MFTQKLVLTILTISKERRKEMKTGFLVLSIGLLLALAVGVGLSLAQGPEPPGEGAVPQEVGIEAIVDDVIPIQGRLTDASGNPLNGNYDITASIYNVSSGGTALCSDTDAVAVNNGLFTMHVNFCTSAIINGQQLYLGIKVGADPEMTPRRAIYPVPYAWSLRPGAVVSHTLSDATILQVINNATTGAGIYAYGPNAVIGISDVPGYAAVYGRNRAITTTVTYGVYGRSDSLNGYGVAGFQTGYGPGDTTGYWESGGLFGGRNGVTGISKEPNGFGVLGWAKATSGNSMGIYGRTDSPSGWAGYFATTSGNGVYISAPSGKTGLNVASGTKSAVVRAEGGSRLLYTEESTEVWFTDYGFGKLQNGVAVITIDPLFAQTVNLKEPYHVFVQPYGAASLYVTNRTPTGFEVRLHDGDPNVEFSYRIVAKRLGYEDTRLERAPWADNDPNLYPEKHAVWEARQGGAP